jgi:hypothetical protein
VYDYRKTAIQNPARKSDFLPFSTANGRLSKEWILKRNSRDVRFFDAANALWAQVRTRQHFWNRASG